MAVAFYLLWLSCCLAHAALGGSPENYAFVLRSPADCSLAAGTCALFVAVKRNASDSAYVDFFLEARSAGWVALGFSTTPDMVRRC